MANDVLLKEGETTIDAYRVHFTNVSGLSDFEMRLLAIHHPQRESMGTLITQQTSSSRSDDDQQGDGHQSPVIRHVTNVAV
jgi:hypothetical protein